MNLSSFDPLVLSVLAAVVGYLIGSLSFAVIVSRLFGLADPRSYGSGNPGATNVLRSGNKGAAILTLVFDALKGYVPVLVALQLGLSETVVTLVGLGAFQRFSAAVEEKVGVEDEAADRADAARATRRRSAVKPPA